MWANGIKAGVELKLHTVNKRALYVCDQQWSSPLSIVKWARLQRREATWLDYRGQIKILLIGIKGYLFQLFVKNLALKEIKGITVFYEDLKYNIHSSFGKYACLKHRYLWQSCIKYFRQCENCLTVNERAIKVQCPIPERMPLSLRWKVNRRK